MGNYIANLFKNLFGPKEVKILLLGLASAGKTTFLYQLKLGETLSTVPTIGFNVESIEYKNLKFTMWDVGGQDNIRVLWHHYYSNTNGIIFMVDSADTENINLAKKELFSMLAEEDLKNASLLVVANKQDMNPKMGVREVAEKLGLQNIRDREWFIQGACAVTGDGIFQGLEWLAKSLKNKK